MKLMVTTVSGGGGGSGAAGASATTRVSGAPQMDEVSSAIEAATKGVSVINGLSTEATGALVSTNGLLNCSIA